MVIPYLNGWYNIFYKSIICFISFCQLANCSFVHEVQYLEIHPAIKKIDADLRILWLRERERNRPKREKYIVLHVYSLMPLFMEKTYLIPTLTYNKTNVKKKQSIRFEIAYIIQFNDSSSIFENRTCTNDTNKRNPPRFNTRSAVLRKRLNEFERHFYCVTSCSRVFLHQRNNTQCTK